MEVRALSLTALIALAITGCDGGERPPSRFDPATRGRAVAAPTAHEQPTAHADPTGPTSDHPTPIRPTALQPVVGQPEPDPPPEEPPPDDPPSTPPALRVEADVPIAADPPTAAEPAVIQPAARALGSGASPPGGYGTRAATPAPMAPSAAGSAGGGDGSGTIGLAQPGIVGFGARTVSARPVDDDADRTSGGMAELAPAAGALGLSPPIQLYTFRADPDRGLAAHPVQCRPERILETVAAVVNRAGGPCEAQRNLIAQAGIELAYVTCRLPGDLPGCHRTYVGTVWVERTPGTHHDYQLRAFGRVARQCGARVEGIPGAPDRRFTRHGEPLGRLFDLCGQRVTGEATSTSASSNPGDWAR